MRIDKFLWAVRLFKTRALAAEACRLGKVKLNDQVVKSSKTVSPNSEIELRKDGILRQYHIKDLPPSRVGAPKVEDYITDRTSPEELERLEFMRMAMKTAKYKGRPTKKDRRELDELFDG
ncbi:RNA-binding protein [Arthrospira sp. O9.13F]|jgi:ribosome-associated heat shock protein Hsp15|nr:RNA-binding protein [Arthrospira sp. O9.13F]